jgi:hypothetical protein
LLLSLSPWHIGLSRGAFEANLTTFFLPFAIYAFIKGKEEKKWMVISAASLGLNMFSYHSARLITPLIVILLILCDFETGSFFNSKKFYLSNLKKYKTFLTVFLLFVGLVIWTMLEGANSRALDITILNPTDEWLAMSQKRFFIITSGLNANVARLFVNKPIFIFQQFVRNYLKYLSPQFFFIEGVSDWGYGMVSGRGVLYLFEIITLSAATVALIKRKRGNRMRFIVFWILVSPLAAALTKGGGAAGTRAAIMMPAIQIFSAYGLVYLIKLIAQLKIRPLGEILFQITSAIILIVCFSKFTIDYIYYMPTQAAEAMQTGRRQMAEYLEEVDENYVKIRVSRSLGVPHIWMMFYQRWEPSEVQKYSKDWLVYDDGERVSIDQYDGYQLGNYIFGNIYYEDRLYEENTLFVGRPEDFPGDVSPLKTIKNSADKPSVYIVESLN